MNGGYPLKFLLSKNDRSNVVWGKGRYTAYIYDCENLNIHIETLIIIVDFMRNR